MKVTLEDIAREAGVSKATVSRALNNKGGVSAATVNKIHRIAQELNYEGIAGAQGVKGSIAFVTFTHSENIITPFLAGVENELRRRDYAVSSIFLKPDELHLLKKITETNLGFIFLAAPRDSLADLEKDELPAVFLDCYPQKGGLPAVVSDDLGGGMQSIAYLSKRGHKKVAIIHGDLDYTYFRDRLKGYRRGLMDCGLEFDPELVIAEKELDLNRLDVLLRSGEPPTAFFAASDALALRLLRLLKKAGYRVPDDISVIGFDDEQFAEDADPPLTTNRIFPLEMGREAARLIVSALEEDNFVVRRIIVETELIVRDSVQKRA